MSDMPPYFISSSLVTLCTMCMRRSSVHLHLGKQASLEQSRHSEGLHCPLSTVRIVQLLREAPSANICADLRKFHLDAFLRPTACFVAISR